MSRLIISLVLLVAVSAGNTNMIAMATPKMDKRYAVNEPFTPLLSGKAFSQHVTHFCLNQVEGFGLDRKFMAAYVIECAADYGVFNVVLK